MCLYTENFMPDFPYLKACMSVINIYNIITVCFGETSFKEVMQETGPGGIPFLSLFVYSKV